MKSFVFYKKINIEKFNKQLPQPSYYYNKKITSLWFFRVKYEVVFFDNEDIINFLNEKLIDLISNEFGLIVRSKKILINSLQDIVFKLDTNNNKLLFGKFGQNKNSLEKYLSLITSKKFLSKIIISIKFSFIKKR